AGRSFICFDFLIEPFFHLRAIGRHFHSKFTLLQCIKIKRTHVYISLDCEWMFWYSTTRKQMFAKGGNDHAEEIQNCIRTTFYHFYHYLLTSGDFYLYFHTGN